MSDKDLPRTILHLNPKEITITADFKNAVTLWNLHNSSDSKDFLYHKTIQLDTSFRYVRYYSRGQCNIGEMQYFSARKKLSSKLISSGPLSYTNDLYSMKNSVDGDLATSFISEENQDGWVGLDLIEPQRIDSIKYSPGLGMNGPSTFIITGHKYEMMYRNNGKWRSAGIQIAENSNITFKNIPSGALYLVHNLTKKVQERCFTIENVKQCWW